MRYMFRLAMRGRNTHALMPSNACSVTDLLEASLGCWQYSMAGAAALVVKVTSKRLLVGGRLLCTDVDDTSCRGLMLWPWQADLGMRRCLLGLIVYTLL